MRKRRTTAFGENAEDEKLVRARLDQDRRASSARTQTTQSGCTGIVVSEGLQLLGSELLKIATQALGFLRTQFGTPSATGSLMAGRSVDSVGDSELVAASVAALASELLDELSQ